MSDKMIISGSEFNSDKDVFYSKPKVNSSGGKNVGIQNASSKKVLFLSTPLMLTWGVNENDFEGTGRKTYDLALQFPRDQDSNFNEDTTKLLEALTNFENKIKTDAISNSKEWFNKPRMTSDMVDVLWTPMLKYPKDPATGEPDLTRSPTLRVKIPYYDDVFKIELYDTDREMIFPDPNNDGLLPMHIIEKGQNIAVVIQNGGIWFANGKFGTTWKLIQAVVQPRASLYGKCHIVLGSSEAERLKKEAREKELAENIEDPEEANNTSTLNSTHSTHVEDSDNEDVGGVEESKHEEVEKEAVAEEPTPEQVQETVKEPVKKRKPIKKRKEET